MDDLQEVKKLAADTSMDPEKRQQLKDRVAAGIRQHERRGIARFVPPRVWVPVAAAGLTGALVIGVVIVTNLTDTPQPAAPVPSVLEEVADKLQTQESDPVAVPSPEQWVYLHLTTESEHDGRGEEETWSRADNTLRAQIEPNGELSTTDGEGLGIGAPIQGAFDTPAEMYEFLTNLPTDDPRAVLDQVYALADRSKLSIMTTCDQSAIASCEKADNLPWMREGKAALMIDLLLRQTNPPAETQAILFRALDEIPTVEDAGTIEDITGKDVIAVRWSPPAAFTDSPTLRAPNDYFTLIDPDTNLYRGQLTTSDESLRDDKLSHSTIVTDHGIVDEPGQVP